MLTVFTIIFTFICIQSVIYSNLLALMKVVVRKMETLSIPWSDSSNEVCNAVTIVTTVMVATFLILCRTMHLQY